MWLKLNINNDQEKHVGLHLLTFYIHVLQFHSHCGAIEINPMLCRYKVYIFPHSFMIPSFTFLATNTITFEVFDLLDCWKLQMGSLLSVHNGTQCRSFLHNSRWSRISYITFTSLGRLSGYFCLLGATESIYNGENIDPNIRCRFFESRTIILDLLCFCYVM
jgi:hypothetical protein